MTRLKTVDALYVAMFSALIAICAWITIPGIVPFTMQTFAVFLSAISLGGKRSTVSVAVYILIGILGLPVFAGGRAGLGTVFSVTGGYIIGFLPCAYISGKLCEKIKKRPLQIAVSLLAGLLCDYILGIVWMWLIYTKTVAWSLMTCAAFILPDIAKIILAAAVSIRFQKIQ